MTDEKNKSGEEPKRYTTHEEFIARMRSLGVPCEDVTPPPEDRKQEIHLFQGPKSFREAEEGGEEVED